MKRLKGHYRIFLEIIMEKQFRKRANHISSVLFCIFVIWPNCRIEAASNVTGNNAIGSSRNWEQGKVSVIQGYPKRNHQGQGYSWIRTSGNIESKQSTISQQVAGLKNSKSKDGQTANQTRSVAIKSPKPSLSPADTWRPVIKNSSENIYKSSIKSKSVSSWPSSSARLSRNVANNFKAIPPNESRQVGRNENTQNEDSERKLKLVVPLHPKLNYLANLLARSFAPLFSVVSLWNQKCWSNGFDQGTCYTKKGCLVRGGLPQGVCAGGFGVCCVFSYTCDSVTSLNRTYFVNPEFPFSVSKSGTTCEHTISNLEGICQLRLDFEEFHLEGPNPEDGICWHDSLQLFGVDLHLPPLCGDLTGHHVYLPVGFGPSVSYTLSLTGERPWRRWKIRTTKIPCGSGSIAQGGCLQSHHGTYGRVTSFNSNGVTGSNIVGLNYGVCVRKERGFCAIRWSKCNPATPLYRQEDDVDEERQIRHRRDTTKLGNSEYLNIVEEEKQKQLEQALSSSMQTANTSVPKQGEHSVRLLQPRALSINTWKPMSVLARTAPSFSNVVSGDSERQIQAKDKVKVAVKDFLEDLTNVLAIQAKSKQKIKNTSSSGTASSGLTLPQVYTKPKTKYSISGSKKPIKLSSLKNVFAKPKIPSTGSGTSSGGGVLHLKKPTKSKLKLPLKNKRPIFNKKKKWNYKKKTKGKNKKRRKKIKKKKGCSKLLPFPLPIAVPFPFGGGGGGGGGGGEKEGDAWGWSEDNSVFTTAMEPFLIRITTDEWKENGLAPLCLQWEQISCDDWYATESHGW